MLAGGNRNLFSFSFLSPLQFELDQKQDLMAANPFFDHEILSGHLFFFGCLFYKLRKGESV